MKNEQSDSLWMADGALPRRPALGQHVHADVCVVGAGIAGLTTAYLLAREGRSVIVLEAGRLDSGQTARTTAHLANAIDDRIAEIERLHGEDAARLAVESHSTAIDRIEAIVAKERIDCAFERLDGYLFVPPGDSNEVLDHELEAAHRAGLSKVRRVERAPLRDFDTGPCLCFPHQGQFHPLKYLAALAQRVLDAGNQIFMETQVSGVEGGAPARIKTEPGFTVTADAVVVATNTPINDRLVIHTKQAAYRTYALGAPVARGSVTKALYWDTHDPYHYVRLAPSDPKAGTSDMLIVGGEDHKTGQDSNPMECYQRLEEWARARFPSLGEPVFRWSGQVMEPVDGLAFIGKNPLDADNVYIATGDSGMGMTHGTIAGMLLTDLIMGRRNPWADLYSPSRKTIRATGEYLKENLNMAAQYADWVMTADVASVDDIPSGSGATIRRGLTKVAVYRDNQGDLHECSATCPHLGAVVRWNAAEQTWDCPAHGSRFDHSGKVLHGPANDDLSPVPAEKATAATV